VISRKVFACCSRPLGEQNKQWAAHVWMAGGTKGHLLCRGPFPGLLFCFIKNQIFFFEAQRQNISSDLHSKLQSVPQNESMPPSLPFQNRLDSIDSCADNGSRPIHLLPISLDSG